MRNSCDRSLLSSLSEVGGFQQDGPDFVFRTPWESYSGRIVERDLSVTRITLAGSHEVRYQWR